MTFSSKIRNLVTKVRGQAYKDISIGFACGFHGKTGAPVAIANIANGLSEQFPVSFEVHQKSYIDGHLGPRIHKVATIEDSHDIYIFDLRIDPDIAEKIKSLGKFVIISIHGQKPSSKNFPTERLNRILGAADLVHFVAKTQQASYQLDEGSYIVIPNSVNPIKKTQVTNNVGVVGNLNKAFKNADKSIDISLKSNCDSIHLWSLTEQLSENPRVIHHSWEYERQKIYNSFDILVFLSEKEALSLAVLESLSAGIPCVLADFDFFAPFKSCPGVALVNISELDQAPQTINSLLKDKEKLRSSIISFYESNFAPSVINTRWINEIKKIARRLK